MTAGKIAAVLLVASVAGAAGLQDSCDVPSGSKKDCGHVGTNQQQCEAAGCCWVPEGMGSQEPWCFYKSGGGGGGGGGGGSCGSVNLNATSPAFTQDSKRAMYTKFVANLNIQGSGAVVASPDPSMPYYYHWMRDGALSTWNFMRVNGDNYTACKTVMGAYVNWVKKVQGKNDPNGNDVRVEPKFTIPDGNPYTGGWCRPQTDGPGLRANTLTHWATILHANGQAASAQSDVWPLIQQDLAWVQANWQSGGCDLWEEVRSNDFFWGRMAYVKALNAAAALATLFGDSGKASSYKGTAGDVQASLKGHWNGNFLFEAQNRQVDGSVVHALASFGNDLYNVMSSEAAATITHYNQVFCQQFPINSQDNQAGVPGVLYGRYPGDSYKGGNPWQLLTASLAEAFYLAAKGVQAEINSRGADFAVGVGEGVHPKWAELVGLAPGARASQFVAATRGAGDAVMTRLWKYVSGDNGMVSEQIDKNSGTQISAKDLTWSYANVLHALYVRDGSI